nr:immunoglobulin heavy chain junction region [Macaca mulatta]MOV48214.1 immunoglobulin heavy chain junction region [Macaca mulatta]MOV48850.1 immunoglobulin heavy chain junction region [Macaca mulatta]MOV49647.1 immunoglobulin heavy chain junction region [Macaca mulatta]MOV49991.1 immunoglobulin heavy chain junction region [Macaca mulatta]
CARATWSGRFDVW